MVYTTDHDSQYYIHRIATGYLAVVPSLHQVSNGPVSVPPLTKLALTTRDKANGKKKKENPPVTKR